MANGQYERVGRTLVRKGAITEIYEDTISLPDGRTEKWDLVDHVGAAAVVAVRDDGKVLIVRQWRNPNQVEMPEIPAGKLDSRDEPTDLAAARELEEETGYRAGTLERLVVFRPTVAYSSERIDIYLATNLTKGVQHLDDDEFLGVEAWTTDELVRGIYDGTIEDGKTIAGVLAYLYRARESGAKA